MQMSRALASASIACVSFFSHSVAFAQCNVPHVIANGQVADASKVMDNFTAVAACVDQGVKPTGAPQSGSIAVFSGNQSVTGSNLTGDVTTSGGTATTLSDSGVTPGYYINPSITVDAKGRIVSASSGATGGGVGGGVEWQEITLTNPDAEAGTTAGWTMTGGGFVSAAANPSGHNMTPLFGSRAFVGSSNQSITMFQLVDLSTLATSVDAGKVFAKLEAYAADTASAGENPYLFIEFRNAAGSKMGMAITEPPFRNVGSGVWRYLEIAARVPPTARSMALTLYTIRQDSTTNNVAFDGVRAFMRIE